jgi:DNA-binding transcriptional ArsR family regulator
MLNQMVHFSPDPLDRTFAALADPTRRALLARLSETENVSVSELARPFPMSLPAIIKHLDVLSDAGLITRRKSGRTVACRLTAAPMEEATRWLNRYQRFWSHQLERLAEFLEEETCQPPPISSRASPSSAATPHRRRRSSAPGRTRKS